MEKINSYKELKSYYENYKDLLKSRHTTHEEETAVENKKCERLILVCGGTGCKSADSDKIVENLKEEINKLGLQEEVKVSITGCFGFCEKGPIVKINPDNVFYVKVTPEDAKEIAEKHLLKDEVVERLLYEEPTLKEKVKRQDEMSFYKKQKRIALRNCGLINPEDIKECIGLEGYLALGKVLSEMTPDELIKLITDSGLRGRGGGGFSTGKKWSFGKMYDSDVKYIICNADEGDPGAFMDRSILEGDPHSIIEAMAIAGYAIGASEGRIYIRAEYPLAVNRLKIAMDQAKECGLLGENILGTGFNFNIEIKYGAGASYVGKRQH